MQTMIGEADKAGNQPIHTTNFHSKGRGDKNPSQKSGTAQTLTQLTSTSRTQDDRSNYAAHRPKGSFHEDPKTSTSYPKGKNAGLAKPYYDKQSS